MFVHVNVWIKPTPRTKEKRKMRTGQMQAEPSGRKSFFDKVRHVLLKI